MRNSPEYEVQTPPQQQHEQQQHEQQEQGIQQQKQQQVQKHLRNPFNPSRFLEIVKSGNLSQCRMLVKKCPVEDGKREEMLNVVDENDLTALHWAVFNDDLKLVDWLLSKEGRAAGFKRVLATTNQGWNALYFALSYGKIHAFGTVLSGCLSKTGEREEMLNAVSNCGWTILHVAAFEGCDEAITWLLSSRAGRDSGFKKIQAKTKTGSTAAHLAISRGKIQAFSTLITALQSRGNELGKMLNAVDNAGRTVLHLAAEDGHRNVVDWLLSSDSGFNEVLAKTNQGLTALHLAVKRGSIGGIETLIKGCRVDNGERREMINAVDNEGMNVLHHAVQSRQFIVIKWILSAERGLAAGFDINNANALTKEDSLSPLHMAVRLGYIECVNALLTPGFPSPSLYRSHLFHSTTLDGSTVLHLACCGSYPETGHMICDLLRYRECSQILNIVNKQGWAPLHLALCMKQSRKCDFSPDVALLVTCMRDSPRLIEFLDPNVPLGKYPMFIRRDDMRGYCHDVEEK